jgi:hypothetical protein
MSKRKPLKNTIKYCIFIPLFLCLSFAITCLLLNYSYEKDLRAEYPYTQEVGYEPAETNTVAGWPLYWIIYVPEVTIAGQDSRQSILLYSSFFLNWLFFFCLFLPLFIRFDD